MVSTTVTNEGISPQTELGSVTLRVRDLPIARSFYEGVLGLEKLSSGEGVYDFGTPSGRVILRLEPSPGAPARPRGTTGLYHFAILMPDRPALAVILKRLISNSYPLQGAADHYVSEAIYLADPEGNGIELYADRPRTAWLSPEGKLQMGTVALDVDDLLSTLDDSTHAEERIPDGTKLGHIHLQIADLETAIHFYRDVLGFDLMMRYEPSAGFLSAGGYHHHVGVNTWAGEGAPEPPRDAAGLIQYSILVPDQSDLERIVENAGTEDVIVQKSGDQLTISDPANNRIVVIAGNQAKAAKQSPTEEHRPG